MGQLDGRVALISGGARGMGASHARAFVAEGAKVVIGDVLDDDGAAVAAEIGDSIRFIHLDVTKADDWKAAVDLAVDTFGSLSVLVNNAGIVNFGMLGDYAEAQWAQIIGINLTGQFLGITAARDALVAAAPAAIVNISSTAGFQGSAGLHGYTASKFGVRGLTKSVALELGPLGVRANSVHPGVIKTPMTANLELDGQTGGLGRAGEPEEVSNLVVYLASEKSSFSNGSEFVVDGGELAGTGAIQQKD